MTQLRKHGIITTIVLLIVVNLFIYRSAVPELGLAGGSKEKILKVYHFDIGQGDATLIVAPNGSEALIDGGPLDNKVLSELGDVLSPLDKDINAVIATHPDADHIGGLPEILKRYNVDYYFESGNKTKSTQIFKTLEDTLEAKINESGKPERIITKRGERIMLDEMNNVYIDVLYPDRDVSNVESNEASFVGKLVYGQTCFIFSGDAPQDVERIVSKYEVNQKENNQENNLHCQVLKTGHHGSHTSTSEEWVKDIAPEVAVISVGKDNRYGHPHKETLDTLAKYGVKVLRTDMMGRIEIDSDGEIVRVDE